jgi:hypothetical protein
MIPQLILFIQHQKLHCVFSEKMVLIELLHISIYTRNRNDRKELEETEKEESQNGITHIAV